MKHADADTLRELSGLLDQIRQRDGLKEKKLGIFYSEAESFLHFHEGPAELFADVGVRQNFERYPVNTQQEWTGLLSAIDRKLGP